MAPWKAGARRLETASWNLPNYSRVIFVFGGCIHCRAFWKLQHLLSEQRYQMTGAVGTSDTNACGWPLSWFER